jgi:hypothetical protein
MNEELFSKIESDTLREKIFEEIAKTGVEIQIQLQDNTIISIKSYRKFADELIIFRDLTEQPEEQDVIVSFNLPPEKYFLKSRLVSKSKNYLLKLTPYLYKLQRRKNFRLTLPKTWEPKFYCLLQDAAKVDRTFDLYDLSSGGFSFEHTPTEFTAIGGAEIDGKLTVKNRLEINLKAIVKHAREVGTKAFPKIRIGLEIKSLSQKDEAQIMAVLMEVHREIFSKLK